jgi:hypothetical protein
MGTTFGIGTAPALNPAHRRPCPREETMTTDTLNANLHAMKNMLASVQWLRDGDRNTAPEVIGFCKAMVDHSLEEVAKLERELGLKRAGESILEMR